MTTHTTFSTFSNNVNLVYRACKLNKWHWNGNDENVVFFWEGKWMFLRENIAFLFHLFLSCIPLFYLFISSTHSTYTQVQAYVRTHKRIPDSLHCTHICCDSWHANDHESIELFSICILWFCNITQKYTKKNQLAFALQVQKSDKNAQMKKKGWLTTTTRFGWSLSKGIDLFVTWK